MNKFRVWNKQEQEYPEEQLYSIDTSGNVMASGSFPELDCDVTNEVTIEHYTGLKDRKGIEIYSGDIINWKQAKQVHEIKWIEEQASFIAFPGGTPLWLYKEWDYQLEIVGNVHENPELLEVNDE